MSRNVYILKLLGVTKCAKGTLTVENEQLCTHFEGPVLVNDSKVIQGVSVKNNIQCMTYFCC